MEEIYGKIDGSPDGIVNQALMSLRHGLLSIRSLSTQDPLAASLLANGMENLPLALVNNDQVEIRLLTAVSIFVQQEMRKKPVV